MLVPQNQRTSQLTRVVGLFLVVMLCLTSTISVDAMTVNPPSQTKTENLAAPSTLTLSHNAIDTHPEGVATYDAVTDSITMTGIGYGRSLMAKTTC